MVRLFLVLALISHITLPDTMHPLDAYKDICIDARTAITNEDFDALQSCKNRLRSLMRRIKIIEFTDTSFVTIHTVQEPSIEGHTLFHDKYFAELLSTGFGKQGRIRSDLHITSRGYGDIIITHHVLPALGEGNYRFEANEHMRLFVLSERPVPISITIECPVSGIQYKSETDKTGIVGHEWNLGSDFEPVFINVYNGDEKPVSFVLATSE